MTDSKTYTMQGADVTITASVYPSKIDLTITVDLTKCDLNEPDHSGHQLINYLDLPGYKTGQSYWWAKTKRSISVKTGTQARRVIKTALTKIDDAVAVAIIKRMARKSEMKQVFAI